MFTPLPPAFSSRRGFLKLLGGAAALSALPLPGWAQSVPAAAPARPATPGYHPFKIGDLDAWIVSDGHFTLPIDPVWDVLAKREEINRSLQAAFLPPDQLSLEVNVLAVRVGADVVLIDSGCGSAYGNLGGHLVTNLRAAGIAPEQVTVVILSHTHADHFGGLADLATGQLTFPNAHLFVNKAEFDFWTSAHPDQSAQLIVQADRDKVAAMARKNYDLLGSKFSKIAPGQKIVEGIELVAAPGHTPGHCGVLISSGNEQLLHLVDAAHHPALMFPHPGWSSGYDNDPTLAAATRRQLLARAASDRTRLLFYHVPFPGLGHVRAEGKGYAWVPEPWIWS